jgi:hypothetical protein
MKAILRMKSLTCGLMACLLLAFSATTGCSKKVAVDTVKLEYSFQAADQSIQTTVNEAVEAIDKADYTGAVEKLKKVSVDPKLTAEQKTAVDGVLAQLEKR